MATIAAPSSGTVHWGERGGNETTDPAEARRRIGYSGHTPLVYDELTVGEHVELQLRLRRRDQEGTMGWLRRLGLDARVHDRADTLSRGQRQRLSLVQAFSHQPRYLLLDEPGSNLDEAGRGLLLSELSAARRTATIVVATHDPDPFRPLADRTLEVRGGSIRDWGGPP